MAGTAPGLVRRSSGSGTPSRQAWNTAALVAASTPIAATTPPCPSAPSTVSRSQRPHGTVPRARSPRGLRPYRRAMLASTPHSSENTKRSGPMPATPAGSPAHSRRACATSSRPCSAARRSRFFARPAQPLQRAPDRPGVDAHARPFGDAGAALGQGQVVVHVQRAHQRRFGLARDARRGTARHGLGRAPPLVARRSRPAVGRRAGHGEAAGGRIRRFARLHSRQHPPAQVRRVRSRHGHLRPAMWAQASQPTRVSL